MVVVVVVVVEGGVGVDVLLDTYCVEPLLL